MLIHDLPSAGHGWRRSNAGVRVPSIWTRRESSVGFSGFDRNAPSSMRVCAPSARGSASVQLRRGVGW